MDNPIFNSLVYNASLLLAMVFIFHLITPFSRKRTFLWQVTVGLILGIIGIAVMETNWEFVSGIIFDTRTVLLGVTGLFFGLIPTLVALLIDVAYRLVLGGSGVVMGVATILESALIGLVWRRFRVQKLSTISVWELYLFGLAIHLVMLSMTWFLPPEIRGEVLFNIWLPVITIYPVATAVIGLLMSFRMSAVLKSKELLEKEQKARALFDLSFEFIGLMTPEGILLDVNQTALDFIGAKLSEVIGKPFWDTPWWNYTQKTQDQIKEVIRIAAMGRLVREETTHRAKDGTIHNIDFTVKPVFNEHKKVISLIPEGRDITDQRRSVEALEKSKERYRILFESVPSINFILDTSGKILSCNHYVSEKLGYLPDELIGKSVLDIIFNEDKGKIVKQREKILGNPNSVYEWEIRKVHKDGQVIWVKEVARAIKDQDGKEVILVTCQDISESKRSGKALLESEIKLKATLESTADGILAVDNQGKIIFANRRFSELWRIPQSLAEGGEDQPLLDFVKSQLINPDAFIKKVKSLYSSDAVETDELLFKDGRIFVRYSFPMATNGTHIGRVWSFRDVTKERELDKMKTDFVSLASHQLRSPLTGIKWFVELLNKNVPKMRVDQIQDCVRKIGESNERLISLVNDLLITSKVDSGKLGKKLDSYSLKEILHQAVEEQGRIFLDKNIKIVGLDKISKDLHIEVDQVQFTQIFGNLFNNAASYSPAGSKIEVLVSVSDGKVKVSVKDFGIGIPLTQQGKMFSKFFRGDNVAKTIPGSGLGLYVAKTMVENHGGKIWFKSEEGKGTTFFVELPQKQYSDSSPK